MASPAMAFAQIASECEAEGLTPKNGERLGLELAKTFNVQADEVGILREEGPNLVFVYPAKFHNLGSIPVNSTTAVASACATSKRAQIINAFAQHKHVSVFEAVDLGTTQHVIGEKQELHIIQKLMCAPVVSPTGTLGVIEISRKGAAATSAGPDFSPADLQKLVTICGSLVKCFK
jgi:hypothetical protein